MPLSHTYPSPEAAESDLLASGFTFTRGFWRKPSHMDDWYGAIPVLALVTVEHRRVDPEWRQPDYWEIRFH